MTQLAEPLTRMDLIDLVPSSSPPTLLSANGPACTATPGHGAARPDDQTTRARSVSAARLAQTARALPPPLKRGKIGLQSGDNFGWSGQPFLDPLTLTALKNEQLLVNG